MAKPREKTREELTTEIEDGKKKGTEEEYTEYYYYVLEI